MKKCAERGCENPRAEGWACCDAHLEKFLAAKSLRQAQYIALGLTEEGELPEDARALYSMGSNPELPIIPDDTLFGYRLVATTCDNGVVTAFLGHEAAKRVVIRGVYYPVPAQETEPEREPLPTDQYGNVLDGGEDI